MKSNEKINYSTKPIIKITIDNQNDLGFDPWGDGLAEWTPSAGSVAIIVGRMYKEVPNSSGTQLFSKEISLVIDSIKYSSVIGGITILLLDEIRRFAF